MTDLVGDDTPGAGFVHPGIETILDYGKVTRFRHRLRTRLMLGCVPILQELQKKKPKNRGYRHKTSGRAEYYLHLLRNYPCGRAIGLLHCRSILRICQISPESLDDEGLARVMAVATIIDNLAMRFTDEACKRLPPVFRGRQSAHATHAAGRAGEDLRR